MKGRKINSDENKNQNNFTEIQNFSGNWSLTRFILTGNKWLPSNHAPGDAVQLPPPFFNQNFSQGNQLAHPAINSSPLLLSTVDNTPGLSLLKPFSQPTLKTLHFPTQVNIFQKSLPGSLANDSAPPSRVSLYHVKLVPCWLHTFLATDFLLGILSIANTEAPVLGGFLCRESLFHWQFQATFSSPHHLGLPNFHACHHLFITSSS